MEMEIKNLSQLKLAINSGKEFMIRQHYIKPNLTGQLRKPSVIQTNGFYSKVPNEDHPLSNTVNIANDGKGYWFSYGKAKDWIFEDGLCKCTVNNRPIWEIEFVD